MTQYYDRTVIADIMDQGGTSIIRAGITPLDVRVEYEIRREASSTPAEGNVTVWDLKLETAKSLEARANKMALRAGYDGQPRLIIEGPVKRVEHERSDVDRKTILAVGGVLARAGNEPTPVMRNPMVLSYAGDVPLRDIVRDIAGHIGLMVADISEVPDVVETDAYINDQPRNALTVLLRKRGVEWYEENGVIHFSKRSQQRRGTSSITVDITKGLVGSPTVTDKGIRIRMLSNPSVELGCRLVVDSELVNGSYKVIELTHRGDSRENKFTTECRCIPL